MYEQLILTNYLNNVQVTRKCLYETINFHVDSFDGSFRLSRSRTLSFFGAQYTVRFIMNPLYFFNSLRTTETGKYSGRVSGFVLYIHTTQRPLPPQTGKQMSGFGTARKNCQQFTVYLNRWSLTRRLLWSTLHFNCNEN